MSAIIREISGKHPLVNIKTKKKFEHLLYPLHIKSKDKIKKKMDSSKKTTIKLPTF